MPDNSLSKDSGENRRKSHYGWLIVIIGALMMAVTYGLMYSYSVFFKPMAAYFSWDRATVSAVYSTSLILRGAFSIGIGWLADRYGATKILAFCGFMIGLGLILTSRVNALWQFFITYSLIESVGLSGTFGIVTALTSRWFVKYRGLALGVVSSGVGLGTLFIVPGAERLIAAGDWSYAYLVCGIIGGAIMIACAVFMRPVPPVMVSPVSVQTGKTKTEPDVSVGKGDTGLWQAMRSPRMLVLLPAFLIFFGCTQMVTVHLVNHATDIGITPLIAASLISIMGITSIAGRMIIGTGSEKIGINNALICTHLFLVVSYVCLIFTRELWTFYLFAVIFGFTYGGEVPQIPLFIGKFFGTRTMATLMGLTIFVGNIGGALGSWIGGWVFDITGSYHRAFVIGAIAGTLSLGLSVILKSLNRRESVYRYSGGVTR
ncbi:MAG: MFS transporter [Dehalococcoidales bacterium]|nr:MFS transporter [Dehalococcoidales bacterium]